MAMKKAATVETDATRSPQPTTRKGPSGPSEAENQKGAQQAREAAFLAPRRRQAHADASALSPRE